MIWQSDINEALFRHMKLWQLEHPDATMLEAMDESRREQIRLEVEFIQTERAAVGWGLPVGEPF